jgi:phosphatidate cytidylyltransferase
VSPGKTVEGGVAQLTVSALAAIVGAPVVQLSLPEAAGIGILLGAVGQIGDLSESFPKRSAGARTTPVGSSGPWRPPGPARLLLFNVPALVGSTSSER